MGNKQQTTPKKIGKLHPRNLHRGRYDLTLLSINSPDLKKHIRQSPTGDKTINFSDDKAVLCLNKALLSYYYKIKHWDIPEGYLCPPIPGRADYIHYAADLLESDKSNSISMERNIRVLDIGTGSGCIYPIIGFRSYNWRFTGTDIDSLSIQSARLIVESNPDLKNSIKIVQQRKPGSIYRGIIKNEDRFDLTMCNPPFHASIAEAAAQNKRKWNNLKKNPEKNSRNFGGQKAELWCPGGELAFIKKMIYESTLFSQQVRWFTSLVSKHENLRLLKKILFKANVSQMKIIKMQQGQKISRFIAWSFLTAEQRRSW